MKKRILIALTILFTVVCAFLFNIFYQEAKNTAITKLNEEQMIHAKQAALGIEDFFATLTRSLNSLSKMDAIIDNDATGKGYMKLFYEAHEEHLRAITRVDERGVIVYNFPQSSSVGADISDQQHIRELLREHKPVISDVFRAIEGFDAVALYVPIFRGSVFKGGIAVLVRFESIANRYLDVIKIGETGYAWVVSRDGTELYSPIPGFSGKSVFENIKDSPSLIAMVNDMLEGHEGAAIYDFDRIGDRNVGQIRKYAVYMPVHIANTFWSIAVASAEEDVLSGLISFRNKLASVICALFICGMAFSTLGTKAWLIVKEEEKRKQAEKKLKESEQSLRIAEQQYRSIFENALEGIYETTQEGKNLISNPALAKILGYDSPEDLTSTITDSAHQVWVDPNQRLDYVRLLEQTGVVLNYECEYYRKDKTRIWVSLNARRVVGPDGETLHYSGFIEDITERKRAEKSLTESESKFRSYIESAPLAIFVADREGRLRDFNPAATNLLGYDAAILRNKQILDLHPEDDREKVLREFATLLSTGHVETELRVKKCDGQIIWVSLNVVMISERLSLCYCQDITERRFMREQLTAAAEEWQATFDSIQDQVLILDSEFRILRLNAAAVSFLGLPPSRALGRRCHVLMHGTDESVTGCPVEIAFRTGQHAETEIYHEGKNAWLLVSADPILDSTGKVHNVVHRVKDITERQHADETLRQHEKDLMMLTGRLISSQEEELRRLSRELHDDLTQRLAVLAMDAGMMEHQLRPLNAQAAEETRDLKTKLIEVSEDVHDLSRQLHPSILDDLGLVQAVQSECVTFTKRTGIVVSLKSGDVLDAIPNDIALCLYRIIQEGLRNVAKHAKTNEACIVLDGLDGAVTLLIQDPGIGFDLKEVKGQLGIGLTGMKERVRLVGGTMSLRSQPGEGTEIQISIPFGGKHG